MTGWFGSWNTQGGNEPTGIPDALQTVSGAGPITVLAGQSVHVTAFASINNSQMLSGPLYFLIVYFPADAGVGVLATPVGEEQEYGFTGDTPTFQIGSTALIQNLPPGSYYVGLAARVPPGPLINMLAATAGAGMALVF